MIRRLRTAILTAATISLVAAGTGVLAGWAPAAAAQDQGSGLPISVVIGTLTPVSPNGGSTLKLTGSLRNTSGTALDGLEGELLIGPYLANLEQFSDAPTDDTSEIPAATVALGSSTLAPGARTTFTITVPLNQVSSQLLLPETFRVYPLQVDILDSDGVMGQANTFLPYSGGETPTQLRVVTLWPIDEAPSLAADGSTVTSPAVERDIAPTGRLGELVKDGSASPLASQLTWVVEPSLLETTSLLEAPYQLAGQQGTQKADGAASAFLHNLSTATAKGALVALPYADPDLVALTRAGLDSDIAADYRHGDQLTYQYLKVAPDKTVAWPTNGLVTSATLNQLAKDGLTTVLISDAQLPSDVNASPPTATAPVSLGVRDGQPLTGLATDSGLTTLLAAGGRDAPNARMAEQLILAYTAVVVSEQPGGAARDIVAAPPTTWNPEPGYPSDLLYGMAHATWLTPVTLPQTSADPDAGKQRDALGPYPSGTVNDELPAAALSGKAANSVANLESKLASISAMFGTSSIVAPQLNALRRAESVAWRPGGDPAAGLALRNQVLTVANNVLASVQVAATHRVTLTSRNSTLPVTIANNLPYPVHVLLTVTSTDPTKLKSQPPLMETVPKGNGSGSKLQVRLPVVTQRSGTFTIHLIITTPDGEHILGPTGEPTSVIVSSHNYGALTIAITGAALALLVGSLLVRLVRRLRRRPAPAAHVAAS